MESKLGDNIGDAGVVAQSLGTVSNNQVFLPKTTLQTNVVPESLPVPVSTGSYFSIFGFELSKTTVFILLALLVLVGIYYYYSKYKKVDNKKKTKKNIEKEQPKDETPVSDESE